MDSSYLWWSTISSHIKNKKGFFLAYINSKYLSQKNKHIKSIYQVKLEYWYQKICLISRVSNRKSTSVFQKMFWSS